MRALSVVIPALNAAAHLPRCLGALGEGVLLIEEILVSDGGSADETAAIAAAAGARVVVGAAGRGGQLGRGVAATRAPFLLILHADTVLEPGWTQAVAAFLTRPDAEAVAGFGRLAFDAPSAAAKRVARLANWRARRLGLPYGDQALLISRRLYDAVGGFPPIPLMEDVALARALGRRRLVALDMTARTSAERYRRDGWIARPLRNLLCLTLYFLGVAPERLVALYRGRGRR